MQFIVLSQQLKTVLFALIFGAVCALAYDGIRFVRYFLLPWENGRSKKQSKGQSENHSVNQSKKEECDPEREAPQERIGENRAQKRKWRTGELAVVLADFFDVLYGAALGCAFSIFLFACNNGRYRWYLLFSAVVGFALYRLSVGRLTSTVLLWLAGLLRKIFGFAARLLFVPIKLAAVALGRLRLALLCRRRLKKEEKEKIRREKFTGAGRKKATEGENRNGQSRKKGNKLYG